LCFNFYHGLFYVQSMYGNYIKIVPSIIEELLDAKALAYWIMCDGSKVGESGLHLCTDSFTLEELNFICSFRKKILI
jgi:hypothetical protein